MDPSGVVEAFLNKVSSAKNWVHTHEGSCWEVATSLLLCLGCKLPVLLPARGWSSMGPLPEAGPALGVLAARTPSQISLCLYDHSALGFLL